MGIANDSISSIINNSALGIAGKFDAWYGPNTDTGQYVPPYSSVATMPGDVWYYFGLVQGINDNISSIKLSP